MASDTFMPMVTLTKIDCGACGGTYAINERYRQQRHEEGKSWRCPYCHCWWGYAKGENAQLREDLERANAQLANARVETKRERDRRLRAERQASAARGQVTKIKNRVAHGVCPCCKRTFKQLAAHMKRQHPDYTNEPVDD